MLRMEDITGDLKEAVIAALKGFKVISKLPGVPHSIMKSIVPKWKTFRTDVGHPWTRSRASYAQDQCV